MAEGRTRLELSGLVVASRQCWGAGRERPELAVDDEGLPLFLTTGVELAGDSKVGNAHRFSFVLVQNVSRRSGK